MASGPRFYCDTALQPGSVVDLPAGAARHVQVLRLQPGATITLFNGADPGGEFGATVSAMGRQSVQVLVGEHRAIEREAARPVVLAVGIPANERMDWLVEKATELGVAVIQPLTTERSVVRLDAQRAEKKLLHWRSITIAACEQCGRNRLPEVRAPVALPRWLQQPDPALQAGGHRLLLSLGADATTLARWSADKSSDRSPTVLLCGPEGGMAAQEETRAREAGFAPVSLGPRVLRAETAAIAALTLLA